MNLPEKARLVEVGPRDGLQGESRTIPLAAKLRLIEDLVEAGHRVLAAARAQLQVQHPTVASFNSIEIIDGNDGVIEVDLDGRVDLSAVETVVGVVAIDAAARMNSRAGFSFD